MKTIEENNQLIAEFLGSVYKADNEGIYGYYFQNPFAKDWEIGYQADDLQFHTSWDWLMPVVEKIEVMGYLVTISTYGCNIQEEKTAVSVTGFIADETKLEATYQAVTEFINWYKKASA
jgi:hypothetical protein